MKILVAYASKRGATQGIAEHIGETLRAAGFEVEVLSANAAVEMDGFDAFVIGSAAYIGHWLKEATAFVRRNQAVLASRPVWLFSSGPLGTATTDAKGRDVRVISEPKEFAEFDAAIHPRDQHIFFGALVPSKLGLGERLLRLFPAGRRLLPEGDFRDWREIEDWAAAIASALAQVPAERR